MNRLQFKLTTKHQLIILLILAFGLNLNTLFNQYAVDDPVVLTNNTLVQKGIKGIPEILTKDLLYGILKKDVDLSGGRYRPVALIVFALEYQFFGINPYVSHSINILLFVLLIALLFKILKKHIFKDLHPSLAFVTCLLFVVHPIHTEVIANVKSRDELITFILLLITSFSYIRYFQKRSIWLIISGLTSFFLALLTRESAVPFILVIPMVAYFFYGQSIKKAIQLSLPLIGVFIVYMAIRFSVEGFAKVSDKNVMNYPFIYATASEGFATKIVLLFKYVWLMFIPHPLICDYGYNQVQFNQLFSFSFIFSFLILLALIVYAFYTLKRRSLFSFCIFFFMATIFFFANFVIDLGAFMAERLLFQPSLAYCIVTASVFLNIKKNYQLLSLTILGCILILFSFRTVQRNHEWKNDRTIYFADLEKAPNSVRVNFNVANEYIIMADAETDKALKKEYYSKAVVLEEKVLTMFRHDPLVYIDLGYAYQGLSNYFKAGDNFLYAYRSDPENPDALKRIVLVSDLLYNDGNKYYRQGNSDSAIVCYKKAVELNENNLDAWRNLSRSYLQINDTINAKNTNDIWQMKSQNSPH
ncbi:MAG: tetratricopeptide repeat protein [Bacteroidetes bacterium]|nr:tetratricopeptide repeat protein [Bacteroidota bacterium]